MRRPILPNSVLAAGFAIAAVWRGMGLWHRGLLEHDEGHALLNANTWCTAMQWFLSGTFNRNHPANAVAVLGDTLHQQGGTLYSAGKLGYSLIVAIVALPGHVSTGLALTLAWVAGLLVAALAGAVAWQYSRSRTAVAIAAGGCLTSPLLTQLSREASGTIWAIVFGLAGAWVIQYGLTKATTKKRWAGGILGGLLLAYGFTCHFNLAPFILAVYIAAALYALQWDSTSTSRLKTAFTAVIPSAVGGLLGLVLAEGITRIVDHMLRNSYPDFLPFSGELHRLFFRDQAPMLQGVLYGDGAIGWSAKAWSVYGRALLQEGPVWLFLIVVLIPTMLLRRRRRKHPPEKSANNYRPYILSAAALLIVPALFWAGYVYRVERSLGMCMAASWILVAVATGPAAETWLAQYTGRALRMVRLAILLLCFFQGCWAAMYWNIVMQELSPLQGVVARTFDSPKADGKLITAGSFDVGYAPLWKWAIVEEVQKRKRAGKVGGPQVDFAHFDNPQIFFSDPSTWRRPNNDFTLTRNQQKEEIAHGSSMLSGVSVKSYLLRDKP